MPFALASMAGEPTRGNADKVLRIKLEGELAAMDAQVDTREFTVAEWISAIEPRTR